MQIVDMVACCQEEIPLLTPFLEKSILRVAEHPEVRRETGLESTADHADIRGFGYPPVRCASKKLPPTR